MSCTVDIEQTPESLHAHAIPEGIDIQPGDVVLVHGAPINVGYGEHVVRDCRATVMRAGPLTRLLTRISAIFELTELYEVSFTSRRDP